MSLFDERIDEQTMPLGGAEHPIRDWLAKALSEAPSRIELEIAATLCTDATPAELEAVAQWWRALTELELRGKFGPEERLRVLMRATADAYAPAVYQPPDAVLAEALLAVDADVAVLAAEDFLAITGANVGQERKGELAVRALARHGVPPAKYDDLILLKLNAVWSREVLEALPPQRRVACFGRLLDQPFNRTNAIYRVRQALAFRDLMDDETRELLHERIEAIAQMPTKPGDEDPVPQMLSTLEREVEPDPRTIPDDDGLTPAAREALQYWVDRLAEARLADEIGPLAESRRTCAVTVVATELGDLDAWHSATRGRKLEIARLVEAAAEPFGLRFIELEQYADIAIAVFEHADTEQRLSLVPGGRYTRGFSEREEALVVAAGEANRDAGNWYETYQLLIEQAPSMRPVTEVHVGAFLVCQRPSEPLDPADATVMFEEMAFRLLTESEHEWAQRAGQPSQLTWRGDDVPDETWIEEVLEAGDRLTNRFGLAGLGLRPEVLADVWAPSYDGAPVDGTARTGDGPRVVRGGAEMLYPWQECGEWHLLANAVRTSTTEWEYFLSVRPALGVIVVDD